MSKNKVRLHAPAGTDEANYSGSPVPYRVDNNGDVEVDEEAVAPLLEKGGFTLVDPVLPVAIAHGHVQVVNPEDPAASCSFGGVSYVPDADGVLTVPAEAVSALISHGFVSVEQFTSTLTAPEAPPAEVAPVAPAEVVSDLIAEPAKVAKPAETPAADKATSKA